MPEMTGDNTRRYRTPFPGVMAGSLEAAINRLLAADENSGERLAKLEGRRVHLELEDLAIVLQFKFSRYRVDVGVGSEEEADTTISGSLPALFAMAIPDEEGRWGSPGSRVKISGDATLARDLERLFSRLDPDLEAGLAKYFGDVMGHQLAVGLKGFGESLRETGSQLQQFASEYLAGQQSPLAPTAELSAFSKEVDKLRDATDRLEARVRNLAAKQDEEGEHGS
jgi:ubiquinone biosynthesis protein UbiJ